VAGDLECLQKRDRQAGTRGLVRDLDDDLGASGIGKDLEAIVGIGHMRQRVVGIAHVHLCRAGLFGPRLPVGANRDIPASYRLVAVADRS
jgi:hypothetical protein